ncbi:ferrochelatase [Neisseria shayeganii]|uniref:Ferrochelatase n=1 Tax=Neisseria shayeganii 871 TaxID=1032488 RepID=G4CF40_9NEIS|nr:ferrochelatase [Neisseria shayeganii]EGY53578.1 ferrochelatase [Neisseria shayeganii 871]
MPAFLPEPPLSAKQQHGTAVLLINLGTPEAPTAEAVRPYLREFLSDQRVVELPKLLWQPILRGFVLPFRPRKSAHAYRQIWQQEGSPLAVFTARQAQALQQALPDVSVRFAMTYGRPSVADTLAELKAQGIGRLLVLPLYPQYAASSSGAAIDKVLKVLLKQRNQLSLRTVSRYYDHPAYIRAMQTHIEAYWRQHGRGKKLMLSFHGIPESAHIQGDPYPDECRHTARLLAEALQLNEEDYLVAFQSQFGRNRWIGPSTQQLLDELPKQQTDELDIFCPGFLSDCLETLEEIAIAGREQFHAAGGKTYRFIPCLNDSPACTEMLAALAGENLHGWR